MHQDSRFRVVARVAGAVLVAAFASPLWNARTVAADGDEPTAADDQSERLERFVPTPEQLRRAERDGSESRGHAYKLRIAPQWSDDGDYLWYRNDLRNDRELGVIDAAEAVRDLALDSREKREYVLIDAIKGTRELAFDHERLAAALRQHSIAAEADRLPLDRLWIDAPRRIVEFRAGDKSWRCNLDLYELTEIEAPDRNNADANVNSWSPAEAPRASTRTGEATSLTFINRTSGTVELFWLDPTGNRVSYNVVAAGDRRDMHTYAGHVWAVDDAEHVTLVVFQADESPGIAEITGEPPQRRRESRRRRGRRGGGQNGRPSDRSPDGRWTAFVRDHNLFLRAAEGDEEIQLSTDGREGLSYEQFEWSPDSATLVANRVEPGDDFQVYTIESSPPGGGRARLHTRPYPLPGDKFPISEISLFRIDSHEQVKPAVDRVDFEASRPHWLRDGEAFAYEQTDRGHQRYRLIEVDCRTSAVRTLIDEKTDTFIWTAHTDGDAPRPVTWLEKSDDLIYASERDGWRHLYLFDAKAGVVKNQITRGEWIVRAIDRIDEDKQQIWFQASGMNATEDPYLIHFYRIDFDGTNLVALTRGDGNHRVQYSPDQRFLIDSYSRVDMPTVHELRRVADGSLVVDFERCDVSELKEIGWGAPEVFTAKGRDGKTDIWGIICRPADFDATKRYPVIEYIYAGPQGSFVPKSFQTSRQFAALNALGFIVVQIDGMGTANRSKAFHDVCWHNLKDAGLPDRVLWHKAVAAKYPQYDVERLGIYGGSAGAQNAAGAVLFHNDFYKAAVAGCGCHDNRMDKASWNEQWMGYPVGPHYAESSNIENAARLTGNLMLIVGELDENVPPESTYRFADSLIKAEKDFDLVVVPGAGHGMGGAYGERRMRDFFVRHLHGLEPFDRNAER